VRPKGITADRRLSQIASRAYGLVTRAQALRAGVTPDELKHRVRAGALIRVHRGVYRVGHHAPSYEAHYLAAVLAGGDGALLSGFAAAHLHRLIKGPPPPPEVTAPTVRRIRGIRTKRRVRPNAREATRVRGIPVTTVERTLIDIAPSLAVDKLAQACHEAGVRYGTTPARVAAVLARVPSAPGARKLRAVLEGDASVTLSKLEERALKLVRDDGLVLPETNRPAGGHRVDLRWPAQRLTVELDGYHYHRSRHAWEQDRKREREARARGDDFRRFTHDDVFETPEVYLRELRAVIPRRAQR
jgi:very-short-patch-repair endonuclease